jgi:Predicted metal-dependent hydrolase
MPTAERTVDIQGEAVAYQVRRSEKASQVRIDAGLDGITLVVPDGRDVDPDEVLLEKADWVLKQKGRFARYRAQMPERRFEEGETFPVLGADRTVVVGQALFSHITDEKIHLAPDAVEDTSIKEELERLYREEARRHFTERVEHFAEVLGVKYEQIQIRNQKTRWGSYSTRTGTLSLNFRLLMAPPDVVDYVIVHELAHAEHPNHGPRFWRLVEQHVPDYEKKNEWLKENGTRLIFDGSAV